MDVRFLRTMRIFDGTMEHYSQAFFGLEGRGIIRARRPVIIMHSFSF